MNVSPTVSHHDEVARAMWELFEPYHAVTYFAPEARAAMDAIGLQGGWMAYFASRAAPLGAVPAEVVIATFYNFHPALVRRAVQDCWRRARPEAVLVARHAAIDVTLRRLLGELIWSAALAEAAALARVVASGCEAPGRPLFAANAALPWPEAPHLVLWAAATRLREHRSDGHIAVLMASGVDPCECHVIRAAAGAFDAASQRRHRGWSEEEWMAARERLQRRGWLQADGALTQRGEAETAAIERATDELAAPPWRQFEPRQVRRLRELMIVVSGRIVDGGGIPLPNPMGFRWPPRTRDLFDHGPTAGT